MNFSVNVTICLAAASTSRVNSFGCQIHISLWKHCLIVSYRMIISVFILFKTLVRIVSTFFRLERRPELTFLNIFPGASISFLEFFWINDIQQRTHIIQEDNFFDRVLWQKGLDESPYRPYSRGIDNKVLICESTWIQTQFSQTVKNSGIRYLPDIHMIQINDDNVLFGMIRLHLVLTQY